MTILAVRRQFASQSVELAEGFGALNVAPLIEELPRIVALGKWLVGMLERRRRKSETGPACHSALITLSGVSVINQQRQKDSRWVFFSASSSSRPFGHLLHHLPPRPHHVRPRSRHLHPPGRMFGLALSVNEEAKTAEGRRDLR